MMTTTTDRNNTVRIKVALIGCNHLTAPVELRERIVFSTQQALRAADELRHQGILEEAVIVSTCNRSELYGVPGDLSASATEAMEEYFTSFHQIPRGELHNRLYRWTGPEAVRHLYRVAAGVDSMLLGEAEILGQLRSSYNQALDHGATGPILNRMFQGALEVVSGTGHTVNRVMETYLGADLSAESGEPISLPLNNQALSAVQDLYKKFRAPV